jgi:hypothetical protein
MSYRGRVTWIAAACLHLALVLCGAFRITPVSPKLLAGRVIEAYRDYSGASSAYGFFAPGVAPEWHVAFEACSDPGHCIPVEEEQVGHEARLLLVTLDGAFAEDQLRDFMAASYAARQFARLPHANVVLVKAAMYFVPAMRRYRSGVRPQWRNLYGYAFRRR